jgi:hypothetical protein
MSHSQDQKIKTHARIVRARASLEESSFSNKLAAFWRDLEDNQYWKYDHLSPVQLLES